MAAPPVPHALSGPDSVLSLAQLIRAVDHGLRRSSKRMAAGLGLTGPRRLTIRITGRTEGITAIERMEHASELLAPGARSLSGIAEGRGPGGSSSSARGRRRAAR